MDVTHVNICEINSKTLCQPSGERKFDEPLPIRKGGFELIIVGFRIKP